MTDVPLFRHRTDPVTDGAAAVQPTPAAEQTPWPTEPVPAEKKRGAHRAGKDKDKKKSRLGKFELPVVILAAVVVAVLLKTFIVQPFYIPSGSMEGTLQVNDKVVVVKPSYWGSSPSPGDVVVFHDPGNWDVQSEVPQEHRNPFSSAFHWVFEQVGLATPTGDDLIKRVIATGGQTVKCCDARGNIQVSDDGGKTYRSLNEPYVTPDHVLAFGAGVTADTQEYQKREFAPITVPEGRLFVLGDHRNASADSLYHYRTDFKGDVVRSTVPESDVIGKATNVVWPTSHWRSLGTPETFAAALGRPGAAPVAASASTLLPYAFVLRRRKRRR